MNFTSICAITARCRPQWVFGFIAILSGFPIYGTGQEQPEWTEYYSIERISVPETVDHQVGGLVSLRDGRIAACFDSGEVLIYDPVEKQWNEFARGLMGPLGLVEEESGAILVMQWSELTRLTDTDSDGKADFYETVFDGFGISGNYHEFAYGPARDAEGNLYIALNVASNNGGVFKEVRGPWTPVGLDKKFMDVTEGKSIEKEYKSAAGRMYSRVPYRGWVLKIAPDGTMEPFASGFRSPDGIGVDDNGKVFVTDNQGDWRGTSPLYHVEKGGFYGHPASLNWLEGFDRNPLDVPIEELESMRSRAAGLFPYGELANSPTQPIPTIDPAKFGLPKGELLIGDMNQPNLIRFLGEEVEGVTQGALIPFMLTPELGIGNHRFAFDEAGSLWIGKTHLKWAGDEGLAKLTWKGNPIFLITDVKLRKNGFEIGFNQPLEDKLPEIVVSRHTYTYGPEYGSPKVDPLTFETADLAVGEDRKRLTITLPEIWENYLHTIQFRNLISEEGLPLMGDVAHYFVNEVRRE